MSAITMILCHGTHADFKGFDPSEYNESGAFGSGFYFSNDIELEQEYSNGLDPVVAKVTLQNPYILDKSLPYDQCLAASRVFRPIEHARERLIGQGYDGVLLIQDTYVEVVAFYPRQIESHGRRPDLSIKDQRIPQKHHSFFQIQMLPQLLSCLVCQGNAVREIERMLVRNTRTGGKPGKATV
ncbi:hypothetical protein LJR231_000616 [Phyllobacterium sp. LjRoot231]|uniref:ADP-ribosyltransferase-containing protein n=1 Tax=Phyllobacterium sp. LjRoot231 TaxID=3342289 RepID=UPI003ECFB758